MSQLETLLRDLRLQVRFLNEDLELSRGEDPDEILPTRLKAAHARLGAIRGLISLVLREAKAVARENRLRFEGKPPKSGTLAPRPNLDFSKGIRGKYAGKRG
jgi:hypothetical protein